MNDAADLKTRIPRQKIFICYAQEDREWLERLQVHLRPLEREGLLSRWDDTCILPGEVRDARIKAALDESRAAVLLVSARFLASDLLRTRELPQLIADCELGAVKLLPLIVSPCLIDEVPALARLQMINDQERPLTALSWSEQEAVLTRVARLLLSQGPSPSSRAEKRLPLEALDDPSCRLLASEILRHAPSLLGEANGRMQVSLPRDLRLDVEVNVAALRDRGLIQTLRHQTEMIEILQERLGFLHRQKESPVGFIMDFSPEIRSKESQLEDEVRMLRDAVALFIDRLRPLS